MGNPLPRTQSLSRQKCSSGQKWDSALGKSNKSDNAVFSRHTTAKDRMRSYMSGELSSTGRPRTFLSGELHMVRAPALPSKAPNIATRDAATNTDQGVSTIDAVTAEGESAKRESLRSRSGRESRMTKEEPGAPLTELLPEQEAEGRAEGINGVHCLPISLQNCSNIEDSLMTSIQTEKEGSHSRLLSRGGESSSFRGRQLSSSMRRDSSSFRKETVSSSFRKDGGPRKKERKATKSFQDGEVSSVASESARGSPCSIHYHQGPFAKSSPAPSNVVWSSSPSSPDTGFGKSSVPFEWEEAPGKAKTIAAAAEMALARKLVRDESLRRLHALSPRNSVDGYGACQAERKSSLTCPRDTVVLSLPPSKKGSQELILPRKDMHSSQLIEELKAAVVRKQAEDQASKLKAELEDDARSVISDYGPGEQAHIDLVAPAAAKILNREDDMPIVTPLKTPLAAVPFKWEEAPGKPKECGASPSHEDPPLLSLPPRLLGGCHNPSKEQQAKILHSYSCNHADVHWTASGNPTPLSRSRDATPTRRDRTPTRRDRTPTKRDITPGKRDITPTRRDSTPTRSYFPPRALHKSGPVGFPVVPSRENLREQLSGPLRSNTHPNYLNVAPRSVSQEFARVTQETALMVLVQDLELTSKQPSDAGSGFLQSHRSSRRVSQELQIVPCVSASDLDSKGSDPVDGVSEHVHREESVESLALVKVPSPLDPLSPTSILCGPDASSSRRSPSNLSSAYAESSHSHHQESLSGHSKTESCTSLESFVDEAYNLPPWSGGLTAESSPFRDLGPIDTPYDTTQSNKPIESMKAIVKFCRKAKKWNKSRIASRKNSAEPDMWAPTLATYFQKLELGGTILNKVGSQVFPEKEVKTIPHSAHLSVPCSPLRFIARSGELTATPDQRLGARKPLGSMTPVHVITTCRSPAYRVMATDECFAVFSLGKVWTGTKARQAKWGRKMKRSSRLMAAIFGALKRSMSLKCGRHTLPSIPSDRNLLDREVDAASKDHTTVHSRHDGVHSLSGDHQFHRPL